MKQLQHIITTGRHTLPISIFLTIICWVIAYAGMPQSSTQDVSYTFMQYQITIPDWGSRILGLISCFVIGFFLIRINNYYAIIRRRASVQTSLFLLFVAAYPLLHLFYIADIAIVLVLFSVYNLFKTYQRQQAAGNIFNSFVFLGLGSLLFPQLLWFSPIFFLGVAMINKLTLRNFIAGVLGVVLPCALLWAYAYYLGDMEIFQRPFRELLISPELNISITKGLVFIYFFVVFVVCSVYCFTNKHKDKIRTRIYLRFIILFSLSIFIFIFLYPSISPSMTFLLFAGLSVLAAHFLVLSNSKASNMFCIGALIGLVILFVVNIWITL